MARQAYEAGDTAPKDRGMAVIIAIANEKGGVGKTTTAVNLAAGLALRLSDRSAPENRVLLVDMDIRKPQVASYLGLPTDRGLLSILEKQTTLREATLHARIGDTRLAVLPCEAPASSRSEWMSSQPMSALLQDLRREAKSRIVIIDFPPVLAGDDVISILPQIDCVLFVVAVGTSTMAEVKECNKHLQSAPVVRIVVNKTTEPVNKYYY